MHIVFIPYGKRDRVELLLRDMEATKHQWRFKDAEGNVKATQWHQSQVRALPLGAYEYVCPKEDADMVMATLGFDEKPPYNIGATKLAFLRKLYNLQLGYFF